MSKTAEIVSRPLDAVTGDKSRVIPLKWWRRVSQSVFLIMLGQWSFYGIFRCPFLVPYVSCQNCPVITCHGRLFTTFWGFWLALPLSVLVFGRAFCGWACPGGFVSQLFAFVAPVKMRIQNAFTKILPGFKILGLAAALYLWLIWGQSRENVPIRIGEFFSSVALTFEHATPTWLVRTIFVLGFLALGLLLANAWCRFACPTGGLLELLKPVSWLKVFKNEKCDDCNECRKICEMGTRPAEADCTNCCDCLSVCPQNAILIGRRKS